MRRYKFFIIIILLAIIAFGGWVIFKDKVEVGSSVSSFKLSGDSLF